MVPHRRWVDHLILWPLIWARPWAGEPLALAVWHGLLCSVLPLLSLAVALRMLRGALEPLRLWAVLAILLAPLPGQIVLVGEVTPALQAGSILLVFAWCGCPGRWAPVALLAGVAAWGLHPVSAALFFYAATTSGLLATAVCGKDRRRFRAWAALFALAAVGKSIEVLLWASPYERENLHGAAWRAEMVSGALLTPWMALIPVFIGAGGDFLAGWRKRGFSPLVSQVLWVAAFVLGLGYALCPGAWGGALSYRKFGIVTATPLVLLGGLEAWRYWRARDQGNQQAVLPARCATSLLLPAVLFLVILGGISLSWRSLWRSFSGHLAGSPGRVVAPAVLSPVERASALNHWSATPLSLVLQGWNPAKVYVWNAELQQSRRGFSICPGDPFAWSDGTFKLEWIGRVDVRDSSSGGSPRK